MTGERPDAADGSDDADERPGRISRRAVLAAQSLAIAGFAASGTAAASDNSSGSGGRSHTNAVRNTVSVSHDDRTETPVSKRLFGRLSEHYEEGTIYPGVYSEHVKNSTFYPRTWSPSDFFPSRAFFAPSSITRHDNVPFPWEPIGGDGVRFETPDGGVASTETTNYQRVHVDGARGGVSQKVPLPDFRTLEFDLGVSVRGSGVDALAITVSALHEASDDHYEVGDVVASERVDVTGEWKRHEVRLTLDAASGDRFRGGGLNVDTPYGSYELSLAVEGSGHVDVDWVTLGAADAVHGKFNPSTVELLRESDTAWLRWPGGNFASQYNWPDGVGPMAERTARFNYAWGGVDSNFFGTDEYLELCGLCDLVPQITVGWWDTAWADYLDTLPSEAADWVAYCNEPPWTAEGKKRAANGHPTPYDVERWEVGNEVYGPWERGSTSDPSVYASGGGPKDRHGFDDYYDAMTAVDDSIRVTAVGLSPAADPSTLPDAEHWNRTLYQADGERLDAVDVHQYTWGIKDATARHRWYDEHTSGTPKPGYWDYSEVLIMFPTQFDEVIAGMRERAAKAGVDDVTIDVGEWGCYPSVDGPYPGPATMPGGSYFAGMLNAFIRRSETVRAAVNTWVPVKLFPPAYVQAPPNPNPLAPSGAVYGLYSALFEGRSEWHALGVDVGGASRTLPETGPRIHRETDVPYVDAAAMRDRHGGELAVFLTNRNLWSDSVVSLELGEAYAGATVALTRLRATASTRPLPHDVQSSWESPDVYEAVQSRETVADDGTLDLTLGPASVVRLLVDRGHGRVPYAGDDGVWLGSYSPHRRLPRGRGRRDHARRRGRRRGRAERDRGHYGSRTGRGSAPPKGGR